MKQLVFTDPELKACQKEYLKLNPEDRLSMSHFELAEMTNIKDQYVWLKFLKEPTIADQINEELEVYTAAQQRKLISLSTDKANSVGVAQLINALDKAREKQEITQSGPAYVYMYIPPNTNEQGNENLVEVKDDPFKNITI